MQNKKKMHYAWLIAVSSCIIGFVGLGMFQNTPGIFFQSVSESLGIGRGQFATYLTVQNMVIMFTLIIAGKILPKFNIKWVLSLSVILVSATFMGMSQLTALYQFYIAGALAGFGLAFCGGILVIPILINNWFKEKAGTMIGLAFAFTSIGGAVFNPVGSIIIENFGWRMGYFSFGAIGLLVLLPITLFVVRFKPSDMGLLPYGATEEEVPAQAVVTPNSNELPGVPAGKALKSLPFYLIIVFAIGCTSLAAFNTAMPGYAESLGWSPTLGGTAASIVLIGAIFGKMALGYLNDKFGVAKATTMAVIPGVIGIFLLATKFNIVFFLVGAALFGLAFALTGVELPIVTKQVFGLKDFSSIYAYVTMSTQLSSAIVIPLYGFIYDATNSYLPGLMFVLGILVLGYLFMLLALRKGKNNFTENLKSAYDLKM